MKLHYSYGDDFNKDFNKLMRLKYADELMEIDGIGSQLDMQKFSKNFFSKSVSTTADASVDSNANIDSINVIHYNKESAKPHHRINSYFNLWKYGKRLFNEEFAYAALKEQITKSIYINDFHFFGGGTSYCFNFSTLDVMMLGLPFVTRTTSGSPKHFDTFLNQVVEFIAYASNCIAGACGTADVWIVASYYYDKWMKETEGKMDEYYRNRYIKQNIQAYIYRCNQLYRDSIQTPFTNVSIFDDVFLDKWVEEYTFLDGTKPNKKSIKILQQLYLEEMNKIFEISPVTFPITTACFAVNKNNDIQDQEFLDYISEVNLKYGFINIYAGQTSTLSSCCRLRSNNENQFFNTFGAGGTKIGSASVTTINLPRIAYISSSKQDFLDKLEEKVLLVQRINQVRRYIVQKRIDNNHSPIYNLGFMVLKKQYSTCGIAGLYEALEIMGFSVLEEEGQKFITDILNVINDTNDGLSKKYNVPMNCEQVPGETANIKFAQVDKLLGYNTKYVIYSNQFIPLDSKVDIMDRIKIQGMFDKHMTGGAICHLNIVDQITDINFMKNIIQHAIKSGVVYHAINYNLQQCEKGCITIGKKETCPKCGKRIKTNLTRVVGFLTNVSSWHKTRREEDYPARVFYEVK